MAVMLSVRSILSPPNYLFSREEMLRTLSMTAVFYS
jgi:hypothetical protein